MGDRVLAGLRLEPGGAALLDIGLHRATDVVGGYRAPADAGVLGRLSAGSAAWADTGLTRRWI